MLHKFWTGYSLDILKALEKVLLTKYGGLLSNSYTSLEIPISNIRGDTIHEVHAINNVFLKDICNPQ